MPRSPEGQPRAGHDTSHRGLWFRAPGRSTWHTEAHREYGVVWSVCGIRAVLAQAETRAELGEEDAPCTRCGARKG